MSIYAYAPSVLYACVYRYSKKTAARATVAAALQSDGAFRNHGSSMARSLAGY
jgi:hypothetical protein